MEKSKLAISLGQHSLTGHRKRNEDFYGCITPEGEPLFHKGIAVVLADGVGGEKGGREASEYAVKSFLFDYYSTPDSWSVQRSVDQVISSINRWIYHEGRRLPEMRHMATTFSVMILKGTRYYIAHVGDSRIYCLRDGELRQMTADHRWEGRDFSHVLTRGIGLDIHLHLDFVSEELRKEDLFVFFSDGVTDWVSDDQIRTVLAEEDDLQRACERLTAQALAQGSQDNITCQIVRILSLPSETCDEIEERGGELPFPKKVRAGMFIDDYEIMERIHKGRMAVLHKARDPQSGRIVAMKFPNPLYEDDKDYVDRFLREEWAGKRLQSSAIVKVIPQTHYRRSCLYYVMEYHDGETIRQRLDRTGPLSVSEAVDLAAQICNGLSEMHRLEIIHRDIKPENILITQDHSVKILDLGVIRIEGLRQITGGEEELIAPGTPNYMAPELFKGDRGGPQADVYAVGVTLYEMLTGRWPYGEIEPFTTPAFKDWTPPSRFNPEIPAWLEVVLARALERDPKNRYEVVTALLYDLQHPEKVSLFGMRDALIDRDPALFWKIGFLTMSGMALTLAVLLWIQ
jgi:protein phosphatase